MKVTLSINKLAALSLFAAAVAVASADDFIIAGNTAGSVFGNATDTVTKAHSNLVYQSSTFSFSTISGAYSLGNTSGTVNNLGLFTLTDTNPSTTLDDYAGTTFTLDVNFTAPTVIAGSSTAMFNTKITGKVGVVSGLTSSLLILWNPNTAWFTFSNGMGSGWFNITVQPTAINFQNGQTTATVPVTAYGQGDFTPNTPAPAAVLPFIGGLIGVARRRRRS